MENSYCELLHDILMEGTTAHSRNGETRFISGAQLRFNCDRAPLLTGRKMYYNGVIGELAAFFKGPKSVKDFTDEDCNYWNEWGDEDGNINVDYGNKWRDFHGVDQLAQLFDDLKNNPMSRRMMISSWDPSNIENLSLPCCHYMYQFIVRDDKLDMIWIQRSVDSAIGLPADIFLAFLMLVTIANQTGYKPGEVVMQLGHTHIYANHNEPIRRYLHQPRYDLPEYEIAQDLSTDNFSADKIRIFNYQHSEPVKFELNV